MSETLKGRTAVAIAAEQLLDDIINGRQTYAKKLGSEKKVLTARVAAPEKKTNLKAWVLLVVFCVFGTYCFLENFKNKVAGFAVSETGELLKNSTVVFYCVENKKEYTCKTNEKGNFNTKLPTGIYKFWVKDHGRLETSKTEIGVRGESNYRITSFKK